MGWSSLVAKRFYVGQERSSILPPERVCKLYGRLDNDKLARPLSNKGYYASAHFEVDKEAALGRACSSVKAAANVPNSLLVFLRLAADIGWHLQKPFDR